MSQRKNHLSQFLSRYDTKRIRKYGYSAGIVLGLGFFGYQVIISINTIISGNIFLGQPLFLLLSFTTSVLAIISQMVLWQQVMAGLGENIDLPSVIKGYVLSFIPRYIPGTIWGYISRGEWLRQNFSISYTVTNIGSILEIFFSLLANGIWIILGFLPNWKIQVGLLLCSPLIIVLIRQMLIILLRIPKFKSRLGKQIVDLLLGYSIRYWFTLFYGNLLLWGLQGISLQLVTASFSAESNFLSMIPLTYQFSSKYCLAWLIGFIVIFVPAGMGLRETMLAGFLENYIGESKGIASIISIVFRLVTALAELVWLFMSFFVKVRKETSEPINR